MNFEAIKKSIANGARFADREVLMLCESYEQLARVHEGTVATLVRAKTGLELVVAENERLKKRIKQLETVDTISVPE